MANGDEGGGDLGVGGQLGNVNVLVDLGPVQGRARCARTASAKARDSVTNQSSTSIASDASGGAFLAFGEDLEQQLGGALVEPDVADSWRETIRDTTPIREFFRPLVEEAARQQ